MMSLNVKEKARELGYAGAQGWRGKVAKTVSKPAEKRGPVDREDVYAAVGLVFLALSVYYVFETLRRYRA